MRLMSNYGKSLLHFNMEFALSRESMDHLVVFNSYLITYEINDEAAISWIIVFMFASIVKCGEGVITCDFPKMSDQLAERIYAS